MSKGRAKKKQRRRRRAAGAAGAPGAAADQRVAARAQAREQAREQERNARRADGCDAERSARQRPSRLDVRAGVPRRDAIWAPFPLTEIGVAVGLVLFALGFFGDAPVLFVAGVGVLVVVVGELCLREHFSGFRSHSLLLGLLPVTVVHLGIVYASGTSWRGPLALAVDVAIVGALAWWLQRRFVVAQGRARIGGR